MMSSAQTATAVHHADTAFKALFAPDLPSLHRLTDRTRGRLAGAWLGLGPPLSVDVLLDLLASCDRDIFAETVASQGHDPLAAS